jgi:hypothetical protein
MALRGAVASGNWSNPATWNGGTLPTVGDIVASNNFTVTIDVNINVDSLINTAASDPGLTATMTSNTTPSGVVSASTILSTSYPAWQAFDKNNSTAWASSTAGPPQWLEYEFPSPTVVNRYVLLATNTDAPVTWEFQAWNGSSWVVLQSIVNAPKVGTPTTYNFTNTTAYNKYRMFMLAPYSQGYMLIHELTLANSVALASAVAGGGFILSGSNLTVSATGGGFVTGATRLLTYTGSNCVLNGNIIGSTTTSVNTIFHNSSGALTINGTIINTANPYITVVQTNSTGELNINGLINKTGRGDNILVASACTVNIVGELLTNTNFSGGSCVNITGAATVNITGNVSNISGANQPRGIVLNNAFCTVNITGDVFHNSATTQNEVILFNQPGRVTIVGSVYNLQPNSVTIRSSISSYLSIVGSIYTATAQTAVVSAGSDAINLFSGPFICSPYGFFPYQVVRMHLIPTTNSYFEFRDETTNGALSPGAIAPATRLVSPATLVDNLAVSDVRFGTTYALGTLTGTLRMPSANQVTFGIPVDNTFGNAVLTAASVWDYLISNITVENSIGMRLKNVSTPQITGEQLEAFLRLD